jgi:hypothetical protein
MFNANNRINLKFYKENDGIKLIVTRYTNPDSLCSSIIQPYQKILYEKTNDILKIEKHSLTIEKNPQTIGSLMMSVSFYDEDFINSIEGRIARVENTSSYSNIVSIPKLISSLFVEKEDFGTSSLENAIHKLTEVKFEECKRYTGNISQSEIEKNILEDDETDIQEVMNGWYIAGHGTALILEILGIILGSISLHSGSALGIRSISPSVIGGGLVTISAISLLFSHIYISHKMDLFVIQPKSDQLPTYYRHSFTR